MRLLLFVSYNYHYCRDHEWGQTKRTVVGHPEDSLVATPKKAIGPKKIVDHGTLSFVVQGTETVIKDEYIVL